MWPPAPSFGLTPNAPSSGASRPRKNGSPIRSRPSFQLFAHPSGPAVHVEERAPSPVADVEDPTLAEEPLVERCPGERRHDGQLDVERLRLLDEPMDRLEDLGAVSVQSQDEARVHGDAVRLQQVDRQR